MKIDPWLRLGRLPSDVVVFEHSFGVSVVSNTLNLLPYCSCGWVGGFTSYDGASPAWARHLMTKDMKEKP